MGNRDLSLLTPLTKQKYLALVEQVNKRFGYDIFLTDGFRTAEEQNALYQQGRTKPGSIVTYVDGYKRKSAHQFGVAFDIAFRGDELYPSDFQIWRNIANVGIELGLRRGYDMWGFDKPHFLDNGEPLERTGEGRSMVGKVWNGERPNDPLTRLEGAIMMDRLAGLLSDKFKGHDCLHEEHLPIGDFTAGDGTISTINGFKRPKSVDGKITISVMQPPDEVSEVKFTIIMNNVIRSINDKMSSHTLVWGKDHNEDASIKIYFVSPGDDRLPVAFKSESLAYGIAPYEGEHAGKLFINETIDRSQMGSDDYWLRIVLEHELLHTLNLGHSTNPNDIMFYRYNRGDNNKEYTRGTAELLQTLY